MGTRDQAQQCRVRYLNRESVTRFELFARDYSRQARTVDRCWHRQRVLRPPVRGLHDGALDNTQRAVRLGSGQGQEFADSCGKPRILGTRWFFLRCGVPVLVGEY
jgi:hypothetical protein